jgi:outer membrane protein assembly factor BamB
MRNKAISLAVALALVVFIMPRPAFAADPILNIAASGAPGNALDSAGANGGEELLQFTSAHHVFGFARDGVIIASGRHMLRIGFLNSRAVAPEVDDDISGESSAGAACALGRVTYRSVWDGVTVVYEASAGAMVKSTYYVDATEEGVQVDRIRLGYNRPVQIDEKGNLLILYEGGTIIESAPMAWQETEGGRKPVTAAYVLHGEHEVGFSLADYIPGIQVVIDPVMNWNTFLGTSGNDYSTGIAVDTSGNVYVAGYSMATWQGTSPPVRAYTAGSDVFTAKLDSSGALQWNTFLGGSSDDFDSGGITVDTSGNVYVAGYSDAATWGSPVRAYTQYLDGFAAKLDSSSGTLQWNTFLGGNSFDWCYGIAVDGSGNVYVAGQSGVTWGSPVRAFTSGYDGFAAKLDSSGALQWNTFQGGSSVDDYSTGVTVDTSGNVYVAGASIVTWGSPVRAYTAGRDVFTAKLDSSGALQWNTFLGGSGDDYDSGGIAVDTSGNVYVAGYSTATWQGTSPPVRAYAANNDVFAAKLDSSGALQWNTFLGSNGDEASNGIAVDGSGNVYVAGQGGATWGSPVRAFTIGGPPDVFAAKLNSSGALQWNTFLGGGGADYGYWIAVDTWGNVYVAGESNATWGSPVRAYTAGLDGFAAKLDLNGNFVPGWASHTDPDRADPEENTFASPDTTVYMKGTSFANVSYLIAYYDADGVKERSETVTVTTGTLNSQYLLTSDPTAAAGTWHALVQPSSGYTGFGTDNYSTIAAWPDTYGLLADDSFTVEQSAIPEFPTALTAIVALGLCFGIYWWMRRKRLAYVKA